MYKKALKYFKRVDPILYQVGLKIEPTSPSKTDNYFLSLCREITGQQLNGKVAYIIFDRFQNLFPDKEISPKEILKIPDEKLRKIGLSGSKVKYIKDLAKKVNDREVVLENLENLEDEEVIKELVKVKGVGKWTAEMFLMFSLARPDIFSTGDLGLKNAIIKLYSLKEKPTEKQLLKISKKWSPYRSYASLILWKSIDVLTLFK